MRSSAARSSAWSAPTACGKTTLINAITGFYPPQRGTHPARRRGHHRHGAAPHRAAGRRAHLPEPRAVQRHERARQHPARPPHPHAARACRAPRSIGGCARQTKSRTGAAVEDVIDFLQLEGVRDELVDGIPIGLKKRVELARALAAEPSFLILDEPMAGMNQEEKEYMARFILDARDERNVTVLLIEHHMDVITGICDRMLALNYGAMIGSGMPADVVADPRVVEAYIGGASRIAATGRRPPAARRASRRGLEFRDRHHAGPRAGAQRGSFPDRVAMREKQRASGRRRPGAMARNRARPAPRASRALGFKPGAVHAGAWRQPAAALRRNAGRRRARWLRDAGLSGRDARRNPPLLA